MSSVPPAKTAASDAVVVQVKALGAPAAGGPGGGQTLSHLTVRQLTVQGAIQLGSVALNPFTLHNTYTRVSSSENSIGNIQGELGALRAAVAALQAQVDGIQGGGGGGGGSGGGPDMILLQLALKALQDSVKAMEVRVAALEDLSGSGGLPVDNAYLLGKIAALEAMVQSAQVAAEENRLFLDSNFEQPPPLYTGSSSV